MKNEQNLLNCLAIFHTLSTMKKILKFRNICYEFIVPQGSYGGKSALYLLMNYVCTCPKSFHSCLTL